MSTIQDFDSTLTFVKSPVKPNSKKTSAKSSVKPTAKPAAKLAAKPTAKPVAKTAVKPHSQVKTVSYTAPKSIDNTKIELELEELLSRRDRCNDGRYIYTVFHTIMFLIAVYLSFRCNNKTFTLSSFLFAAFFPYVYIVYILATQGTCGLLE